MQRPTPPGYTSRLPGTSPQVLDTPERVLEFCKVNGLLGELGSADIERIIEEDKNLRLIFEDLGEKDAYIMHKSDADYIIGINIKHPKSRQKFSMAHEYAHYQLHRNNISNLPAGEKILHRDGRSEPIEWQANRFAAQILMPESAVKAALKESNENLTNAASRLGVSVSALSFRIDELQADKR